VHYAGHAFFDAADPGRSGILCAGREVLSGVDLAGLSSLPALVFFNACESGRVRAADGRRPSRGSRRGGRAAAPGDKAASRSYRQRIIESSGVAEAFMRGGLANYLGTYWPVGDDAALAFAESFYARLLDGDAIGAAVLAGRRRVRELRSPDWADYILYGDQDFSLKIG
jgi:CHAT domain-containing protein